MSKRTIQLIPENERPPRQKGLGINGKVKLNPGYNSIDESVYQEIKDTQPFKERVEWGAIKVIGEPKAEDSEDMIADLKADDAIALVTSTLDLEQLTKWRQSEEKTGGKNRTTVLNAINRQIETIKKGEL